MSREDLKRIETEAFLQDMGKLVEAEQAVKNAHKKLPMPPDKTYNYREEDVAAGRFFSEHACWLLTTQEGAEAFETLSKAGCALNDLKINLFLNGSKDISDYLHPWAQEQVNVAAGQDEDTFPVKSFHNFLYTVCNPEKYCTSTTAMVFNMCALAPEETPDRLKPMLYGHVDALDAKGIRAEKKKPQWDEPHFTLSTQYGPYFYKSNKRLETLLAICNKIYGPCDMERNGAVVHKMPIGQILSPLTRRPG